MDHHIHDSDHPYPTMKLLISLLMSGISLMTYSVSMVSGESFRAWTFWGVSILVLITTFIINVPKVWVVLTDFFRSLKKKK